MTWVLDPDHTPPGEGSEALEALRSRRREMLKSDAVDIGDYLAEPPTMVWVESEMVDLLEACSPSFETTNASTDYDIAPAGLAWLSRPIHMRVDGHVLERAFPTHAFSWDHDMCFLWSEPDWNEWLPKGTVLPSSLLPRQLPTRDVGHPFAIFLAKCAGALTTLIRQRVAVVSKIGPDRASRRRLERQGKRGGEVNVITLRRPTAREASDESARGIDWAQRWIVGGHWRNHYMPSTGDHRPTWIAPYVKGPDDKPLVVKEKVYRWAR